MAERHIVEVAATATHDVRRRVLRAGTPSVDVAWPGDDDPSTMHLAVVDAGRPIAISTWMQVRSPDLDGDEVGAQLRGMATDPSIRGTGAGAALLTAGIAAMRERGVDHVWANARSTVLDFYVRHGFVVVSDEFMSATTAIPHRRILLQFH